MPNVDPQILTRATAAPPALAEGQLGVLSLDLAGNLRTSSSAAAGASSVTILGGTSSVTLLGTSAVSIVGTSLVSHVGTGISNVSIVGTSLVSSIGNLPVVLQAGANSAATVFVAGTAAAGATPTSNPIRLGGRAATANPTAVSDAQIVDFLMDKYGRQVYALAPQDLWGQGRATITSTTTTSLLAAGGANVKWALTSMTVVSTQTATTSRLDILDGLGSGATIHSFPIPAGISAGAMFNQTMNLNPPYVCSANTDVSAHLTVAVTDVRVIVTGFKVL